METLAFALIIITVLVLTEYRRTKDASALNELIINYQNITRELLEVVRFRSGLPLPKPEIPQPDAPLASPVPQTENPPKKNNSTVKPPPVGYMERRHRQEAEENAAVN